MNCRIDRNLEKLIEQEAIEWVELCKLEEIASRAERAAKNQYAIWQLVAHDLKMAEKAMRSFTFIR